MTALEGVAAPAKAKRRRKAKPKPLSPSIPIPRATRVSASLIAECRVALAVSLHGINAHGEEMVLDEAEWPRIKLAFGDRWGVAVDRGHRYVIGLGRHSGMRLARWIAGAQPGEVVRHINGDNLDLRRSNLVVTDREAFVLEAFGHLDGSEAVRVS